MIIRACDVTEDLVVVRVLPATDTAKEKRQYRVGQTLSPALKTADGNYLFGRLLCLDESMLYLCGNHTFPISGLDSRHQAKVIQDKKTLDLALEVLA